MKQFISLITVVTLLGSQLLPVLPISDVPNPAVPAAQARPW